MSDIIQVESMVNQDYEPLVIMRWGYQRGKLTPGEARAHALRILECADAAESDAFIVNWLGPRSGLDERASVALLREFREFREAERKKGVVQ